MNKHLVLAILALTLSLQMAPVAAEAQGVPSEQLRGTAQNPDVFFQTREAANPRVSRRGADEIRQHHPRSGPLVYG